MLCYGVGVGVGVVRISGRRFIALLARRVFKKMKGVTIRMLFGIGGCGVVGAFVVLWGLDLDCCML